MTSTLSRLRWHTAGLLLQNTRNACAREHPLSIFDAVFKFAAHIGGASRNTEYFFHPLSRLEASVRKGALYELELVFPTASAEECRAFLDGVRLWLDDPARNFTLLRAGEVRERSLAALQEEGPDPSGDELCLDFLTPLSILPATPRTLHTFNGAALFRLVSNRLRRWYKTEADAALAPLRTAFESAHVLPWFWQYAEFHHRAKSRSGRQFVCGMQGPLYVRGDVRRLLPPLLIMQELHLGPRKSAGQGAYRLREQRPFMDARLAESSWYAAAFEQYSHESDRPLFPEEEKERRIAETQHACASGLWQSGCAELCPAADGSAPEAVLPPADLLAQYAVRNMLASAVNNALPRGVPGFRPEKSPSLSGSTEEQAWLLQTNVADFFEAISHRALLQSVDAFLPRADTAMRAFLREAVAMPARSGGNLLRREKGLLPGSPLAPMLADLCLSFVDRLMAEHGPCLRRNISILVPAPSAEAAGNALSRLEEALRPLNLAPDKSRTVIRQGHLPRAEEDTLLPPGGRRPLYVLEPGCFVGMEGESVLVRRDGEILGKAPLHATGGIFLHGAGGVSARLVERCAREHVSLAFCSPSGMPHAALSPCSREWYALIGAHAARHAALTKEEKTRAARSLVEAKLLGARRWLLPRLEEKQALLDALEGASASLERAEDSREIMGVEGAFARTVFPLVNGLVRVETFRSAGRVPHTGKDPWNALLDAAFSLLFARLYTLVQAAGLNPFLGFLHSSKDRYPSLVADLQEPFRHRVDQLVLNLVNQNVLRPEHFLRQGGRLLLEREGYIRLLRAFERMLATRFSGETRTMARGMAQQVRAVRLWAVQGTPLHLPAEPCLSDEDPFA